MAFFDRMKRRKKFYDKGKMTPALALQHLQWRADRRFSGACHRKIPGGHADTRQQRSGRFREEYGIEGEIEKIY